MSSSRAQPRARFDGWGLGFEALEQLRPGLLLTSITPHGQTGARARRPGNDLTAYARSGWASINGLATREPLKGSGFIASYLAGTAALGAVAAALLYRDLHGAGQHIDVAETEALLEIFGPGLLRGQYVGQAQDRRSGIDMVGTFPVPVRDGHMSIMLGRGDRWRHAMIALGLPEVADDDRYQSVESRTEERDEFSRMVESKMAEWDRMELFEALATLRVIAGPVLYVDELARNEQLNARGYFARPSDATSGPAYPGAPVKMSATPWALRRSQPEVGAHTVEVLREVAGYSPERIDSLSRAGTVAGS